ncbi:myoferlin-like isoform X2 [Lissotriton helveticus]
MPDVIIWMLCKDKRLAYVRVKAHTIMFSSYSQDACGKFCSKTQTLFLKYLHSRRNQHVTPVQLRVRLWLGLISDRRQINQHCEGKMSVYAETYENQAKCCGSWGTKGLGKHPYFSDISGKFSIPREKFQVPRGWQWDGEWTVEPQKRLLLPREINHTEIIEDVFENETRVASDGWVPAPLPNTSMSGAKRLSKEEIKCPSGWYFKDEWKVEKNGAIDESGWQYGVSPTPSVSPKSWNAAEKTYHTHRRRHWIRKRCRTEGDKSLDIRTTSFLNLHPADKVDEGDKNLPGLQMHPNDWEFASYFGWKFHLQQSIRDVYRRRCWHRVMKPTRDMSMEAIFLLEGSLGVEIQSQEQEKDLATRCQAKDILQLNTPIICCQFDRPNYFQLRCYIFQGRNLRTSERRSLFNSFIQVAFLHVSQYTEAKKGSLNPRWDQTILFQEVLIYGNLQSILEDPPYVTLELFDKNIFDQNEYLGRSICLPVVCLDIGSRITPQLTWHPVKRERKAAGELLAAFELLIDDKKNSFYSIPVLPITEKRTYTVPEGIRPTLRLMVVEILAWGVRCLKTYELLSVSSPNLLVEFGEKSIQTLPIKNYWKNPNFPEVTLFMKTYLPVEEAYTPPLVLKLLDNRPFGYKPVVGETSLSSLQQYYCDPYKSRPGPLLPLRGSTTKIKHEVLKNEVKDGNIGTILHKTSSKEVYHCSLEEVPLFMGLQDFCQTFPLYRKRTWDSDDRENYDAVTVGQFKGSFRIYPLSEDPDEPLPPRQFRELPENYPQECLVRVYIIRALNLQPRDKDGLSDPYIYISIGKQILDDRDFYIPATLNPEFGRMFELNCMLPLQKDLKIALYDFDLIQPDQLIGETVVDLENRLLSQFGAHCGLPQTFCVSGPHPWRDQLTPKMLLEHYAVMRSWPPPQYSADGQMVTIRGRQYLLSDLEVAAPTHRHLGSAAERLALHVLRLQRQVPEHLETRTLYNKVQQGMEQGKLQMWVDIFPKLLGPPGPPFDISPRAPQNYELRVIVWNTEDVVLQDTNLTGTKMSDIYVKGWLDGLEDNSQRTDVHYRSLEGEGNFNWRFIFPFQFLPKDQMLVLNEKEHFWSLDKSVRKIPPKLIIQIWDNDLFSADDFLGVLELNLIQLPRPQEFPESCTLEEKSSTKVSHSKRLKKMLIPRDVPRTVQLFKQKTAKGWWPCTTMENGHRKISGKVEMTLEILTEQETEERPAGKARDEPNINPKLDPPKRPETSFLWFQNPWRSLKFVIWKRYYCWMITILLLMLALLLLGIFIYSFPNYLAEKMLNLFPLLNPDNSAKEASTPSATASPHVATHKAANIHKAGSPNNGTNALKDTRTLMATNPHSISNPHKASTPHKAIIPPFTISTPKTTMPHKSASHHPATNSHITTSPHTTTNPHITASPHTTTNPHITTNPHTISSPHKITNTPFLNNPYAAANHSFTNNPLIPPNPSISPNPSVLPQFPKSLNSPVSQSAHISTSTANNNNPKMVDNLPVYPSPPISPNYPSTPNRPISPSSLISSKPSLSDKPSVAPSTAISSIHPISPSHPITPKSSSFHKHRIPPTSGIVTTINPSKSSHASINGYSSVPARRHDSRPITAAAPTHTNPDASSSLQGIFTSHTTSTTHLYSMLHTSANTHTFSTPPNIRSISHRINTTAPHSPKSTYANPSTTTSIFPDTSTTTSETSISIVPDISSNPDTTSSGSRASRRSSTSSHTLTTTSANPQATSIVNVPNISKTHTIPDFSAKTSPSSPGKITSTTSPTALDLPGAPPSISFPHSSETLRKYVSAGYETFSGIYTAPKIHSPSGYGTDSGIIATPIPDSSLIHHRTQSVFVTLGNENFLSASALPTIVILPSVSSPSSNEAIPNIPDDLSNEGFTLTYTSPSAFPFSAISDTHSNIQTFLTDDTFPSTLTATISKISFSIHIPISSTTDFLPTIETSDTFDTSPSISTFSTFDVTPSILALFSFDTSSSIPTSSTSDISSSILPSAISDTSTSIPISSAYPIANTKEQKINSVPKKKDTVPGNINILESLRKHRF